jgi:Outer membrane efflux protein
MSRFATISLLMAACSAGLFAQDPLSYAIATPRPIDPAAGSTNPGALATQSLNPYLGSVPGAKLVPGEIKLTLHDAIQRGLEFNLGLVESNQAGAAAQAERARAFSALLPQISARADQSFEQLSLDANRTAGSRSSRPSSSCNNGSLWLLGSPDRTTVLCVRSGSDCYKARRAAESASALSTRDSRDVVVLAVGTAYFQVVSSKARLATAGAALASAQKFQVQGVHQYEAEVAPEIDSIRTSVELRPPSNESPMRKTISIRTS